MPLPVRLDHRAVISVSGPDAETFLNGLLTQSVIGLLAGERRYGALLTPQGKVIADMIVARGPAGLLLDVDAGTVDVLVKRLSVFRLRAAVAIEPRTDLAVFAFDGAPDPRSPDAPHRSITARERVCSDNASDYHVARIAAGAPEQGQDFGPEDVFPADINMDLLNGVDFRKGCFVGQEVVSRMKRRGGPRRRTLTAHIDHGAAALIAQGGSPPSVVLAGPVEIGKLTSIAGLTALVRVRIDRLSEAWISGAAITSGGQELHIAKPDWLLADLAAIAPAKGGRL